MDSLKNILSDIRVFLYGGIQKLPLIVAGTLLILGLFTANYAAMFFLIGFLVVTPLLVKLLNSSVGLAMEYYFPDLFLTKMADVCKVVVPFTTIKQLDSTQQGNIVFSTWFAMVIFFVSYLLTNSIELFYRETPSTSIKVSAGELQQKTDTRKYQAMLSMGSIILFTLIMIIFRYQTGCERIWTLILTGVVFGYIGYSWYVLLASVGEDRLSDLFGIANRLLPPSAIENKPIACIPSP